MLNEDLLAVRQELMEASSAITKHRKRSERRYQMKNSRLRSPLLEHYVQT